MADLLLLRNKLHTFNLMEGRLTYYIGLGKQIKFAGFSNKFGAIIFIDFA